MNLYVEPSFLLTHDFCEQHKSNTANRKCSDESPKTGPPGPSSFTPGPQCAVCRTKLACSGMNTLNLSCSFQGRIHIHLLRFSTSEKQKLLSKILMSFSIKDREKLHYPGCARSHLITEAKQGQAWFGWYLGILGILGAVHL